MLVYQATKKEFIYDCLSGQIEVRIQKEFTDKLYFHNNIPEFQSWKNSMIYMKDAIDDSEIADDVMVAIEYQIPLTSKRVDFILTGINDQNVEHVVVVELKQWSAASRTKKDGIVETFLGGSLKEVPHPSYQAWSYTNLIENFSDVVQTEKINMVPCAYLHNFAEENRAELDNIFYSDYLEKAPIFLRNNALDLRKFIKQYITKKDQTNLLYRIDHGRLKPSIALQDSVSSMLKGNQDFVMIDEQKIVYETAIKLYEEAQETNQKIVMIVEGGPGTGKSVIAVNLLAQINSRTGLTQYVSKNSTPRNVYSQQLRKDYRKVQIDSLFSGSGNFISTPPNTFDCLIVDEAHRLNLKSGIFSHLGENQMQEIIRAAKFSIFFIDEDQIVTSKDAGSIISIMSAAEKEGAGVVYNDNTKLSSQFRCNGSDGYIAWLDNLLEIRETANTSFSEDFNYDFKIYTDLSLMREDLRTKNTINNKTRLLAGYCWDWQKDQRNNPNHFDIIIDDFSASWNFSKTTTWAIDEDSFDQVGCIHTSQGLEFDYVGVIIGEDLSIRDNQVLTNFNKRSKSDQSLRGLKGEKIFNKIN